MLRSLSVHLLALLFVTTTSLFAEIQLSPAGTISTFSAARDAARSQPKPVKIIVEAGVYHFTEPLVLQAADSGVSWEAAPGAHPIISGGRTITGWKQIEGGLWKAEVPGVKEGKWYFEQLWVNGRRAVRARTPNKGFMNMIAPASVDIFPGANPKDPGWISGLAYEAFVTRPDMFAELAKIQPQERNDATFVIPHTWEVHRYRLRELNAAANAVQLNGPHMSELLKFEPDGRFYVENFRAALDAPGEWFLGRDGVVLYQPMPGETLAGAEIIAPAAEMLLSLQGAKDITFRGLTFAHQNWLMGPNGHGDPQAAVGIGGAIEVENSTGITFENCEVAHVGSNAIWFKNGCHQDKVAHCHLHDLGCGGVKVGLEKAVPVKDASGSITIDDNIIQHGGRIFPAAVGVLIGNCGDNVITNNDIGDFYYSAVSLGWIWGYHESAAMRNRVEGNHLHHLGWGFTSDMGGVYNLGPSFGTVISGNHIHHVASYRYGGWGLYTDEGSTGVVMENNLVHDTSESSFHQHYGFYNQVRNNIFAFGGKAQIQRSRAETHLSFILENNIIVWDPAVKLLDGTKSNWDFNDNPPFGEGRETYLMRNNLYWPIGGKMIGKIADEWTWEDWQKSGRDGGSKIADPLFENIEKRDFKLKENSPALKAGFQPWDLTAAGVRENGPDGKSWRELAAKGWEYPNWEADSKPWPALAYDVPLETFETTPVGDCNLPRQEKHVENKGDSIGVSEEAASPIPLPNKTGHVSKRSLKIEDAPDLKVEWDPHFAVNTGWKGGEIHVAFDVMARPQESWLFEIRDANKTGYLTGVGLKWDNSGLTAICDGKNIPVCPKTKESQWMRLEISSVMGSGNCSLTLVTEEGERKDIDHLPCSPNWTESGYLVWISLGRTKTAMFLDNLSFARK